MIKRSLFFLLCLSITGLAADNSSPTKTDDDKMGWWRAARFGMFIHWGIYSVPAGFWKGKPVGQGGEWIERWGRISLSDYRALAPQFNPTKFDADAWVALAKQAGMKYIIITAKHHDGFAMFHSKVDSFNIYDATPFKRDPLAELAEACRKQGIKLGVYYSQDQDWSTPGGGLWKPESASPTDHSWDPWDKAQQGSFANYFETKSKPQIEELLNNYEPAVIWFDTPTANMTPERAGSVVALLKQHPNVIWNNRLGGGFKGDTETPEQHVPANGFPGRDWEACMTMNDTWGYKSNDTKFKSADSMLHTLIDIASKGGNYLLNVGPTSEGVIPPPEVERLKIMGAWLAVNGEAIYGTTPGPLATAPAWGRITQRPGKLYLIVFDWPKDGRLPLAISNPVGKAYLLNQPDKTLTVSRDASGIVVAVPPSAPDPAASVIVLETGNATGPAGKS